MSNEGIGRCRRRRRSAEMRWKVKMWYRQKREAILWWLANRVPSRVGYYVVLQAVSDYSIEHEPKTEMGQIRAMDVVKVGKRQIKWFVSCIDLEKQIGIMQFEASSREMKSRASALAPQRCIFKAYELEEFEEGLPVGEFVSTAKAKTLGY